MLKYKDRPLFICQVFLCGICDNRGMRLLDNLRRNHALEHATLAVLARKGVSGLLAGYSTSGSFWLLAPATGDQINEAVREARKRLSAGETRLAISPSCGTNLAVAALVTSATMRFVEFARGKKTKRWPITAAIALGALVVSKPVGEAIQRKITTMSDLEELEIVGVTTLGLGRYNLHRVVTRYCKTAPQTL